MELIFGMYWLPGTITRSIWTFGSFSLIIGSKMVSCPLFSWGVERTSQKTLPEAAPGLDGAAAAGLAASVGLGASAAGLGASVGLGASAGFWAGAGAWVGAAPWPQAAISALALVTPSTAS